MVSELDLKVFFEVFKPSTKPRDGRWWLHSAAQTYSGDADCWIRLQNAGLIKIDCMKPPLEPSIFDVRITRLGIATVADHYPDYKVVWENALISVMERALEG